MLPTIMKIGRIRRKTYGIISLVIIAINLLFSQNLEIDSDEGLRSLLIYLIVILIIIFILNAGRLNDINLSGWYALLFFVPIINLASIALYFLDGTKGTNNYGNDPKGRINEKKFSNKQQNNSAVSLSMSPSEIDKKIDLLSESFSAGILDKTEFDEKKKKFIEDKQELIKQIENRNSHKENTEKLRKLLENGIITQSEYNKKVIGLDIKYGLNKNIQQQIELNTQLYYISKGKEFGPMEAKKIVSLLNTKKINPNCLVRIENESTYSKRAYEIAELFG